jgi:hypothetical protein
MWHERWIYLVVFQKLDKLFINRCCVFIGTATFCAAFVVPEIFLLYNVTGITLVAFGAFHKNLKRYRLHLLLMGYAVFVCSGPDIINL